MISIHSSKTIRNGLSFDNKVGIFECTGHPSVLDSGVPKGSLAIDYNTPAVWHKFGVNTSDWYRLGSSTTPPNQNTTLEYSIAKDVRPSGEHGGTSREGHWNIRLFNTIEYNDNNNLSIINDDFILKTGVYTFNAYARSNKAENNALRVYNETTETVVVNGLTSVEGDITHITGRVVSNGVDRFELQHYIENGHKRDGLGKPAEIPNTPEVYCSIEFLKIG